MAYKEHPLICNQQTVQAILAGRQTQDRRPIKPQPAECHWIDGVPTLKWKSAIYNPHKGDPRAQILECCPYAIGDHLWVKEGWRIGAWDDDCRIAVDYRADNYARQEWLDVPDEKMFERLWIQSSDDAMEAGLMEGPDELYHWEPGQAPTRWRSPLFMPRWASRITLEVTGMRVQQVQEISNEDAQAEGIDVLEHWHDVREPVFADPERTMLIHQGRIGLTAYFADLWDAIYAKRGLGWNANPWVWAITFRRLEENNG